MNDKLLFEYLGIFTVGLGFLLIFPIANRQMVKPKSDSKLKNLKASKTMKSIVKLTGRCF